MSTRRIERGCPACGTSLATPFCPTCGSKSIPPSVTILPVVTHRSRVSRDWRIVWVAAGVMMAAGLVIVLAFAPGLLIVFTATYATGVVMSLAKTVALTGCSSCGLILVLWGFCGFEPKITLLFFGFTALCSTIALMLLRLVRPEIFVGLAHHLGW